MISLNRLHALLQLRLNSNRTYFVDSSALHGSIIHVISPKIVVIPRASHESSIKKKKFIKNWSDHQSQFRKSLLEVN